MIKYLDSWKNGSLKKTADRTSAMLKSCVICPRKCRINRLKEETGFCKTGSKARVHSFLAHHGEEPPISGKYGSGTIFFSGCNMACAYCQNFEFSQNKSGKEVSPEELAGLMLRMQKEKCHNINLVTPTHVMPQILQALVIACENGLKLPLIYNTSGYEDAKILRLLDGIIDVYLADMRYADKKAAKKYSFAPDYPQINQKAIKEMHRQAGIAKFDKSDIIESGLVIRHLVLPKNTAETESIMRFINKNISTETYTSRMSQYTPYYRACDCQEINRRVSFEEYEQSVRTMEKYGLHNGWTQDSGGLESFAGIHIKPNL
ncbi:MAG: radical SAM protein [Candidatus Omnitrophica bacterium]|nr:radical SAM protein [Candidatus Omnitrophota bacterium]